MSKDYSPEIRQRKLNIERIEADANLIKSDIVMLEEKLNHVKRVALEKQKIKKNNELSDSSGKYCYFCDELIRKKAKVCRFCYRAQPDVLLDVAKAKIHIATLLHERVEELNNNE